MTETANYPAAKKKQDSALIFIGVLICAMGYVALKEDGPGMLFYVGGFIGAFIFFMSGLYKDLFKPEVALYFLVAYFPFSHQIPVDFGHRIPGFNLTNLTIFLVVWLWLKSRDKTKPLLRKTALNVPIFIFTGLGVFSVLRSLSFGLGYFASAAIEYYRIWAIPFVLYFYIVNSEQDTKVLKNVVLIIMAVTTFVALMSIYEYMDVDDRVGGIFEQPNHLASFFNYYIYLFFAFFLVYPKYRWVYLIPFAICFRGIMVTFSRAGYLSFAVGMYAITCFRSRVLLIMLVLLTIFLYFNPAFLPEGVRYRMAQTFDKQKVAHVQAGSEFSAETLEDSAAERLKVWEGAKAMIREHPVFGVGYQNFEKKILHYWVGKKSHDPHNGHLLIASEMGVPALLVFYFILLRIFWASRKLYKWAADPFMKSVALGMMAGIPSLFVSNLYGSRLSYIEVTSYFWILTGIIVRWKLLEEEKLRNA